MKNLVYITTFVTLSIMSSCNNTSSTKETNSAGRNAGDTALNVSDTTQTSAVYRCPMDCEKGKTYSKPGQCPVCGMDLVKK